MADMNFGVNLLPVTTATYSIGSSSKKWQINGVSDPQLTDTTYTFASGTNSFTVTPSGGTAQTVAVTPSITNNITGSGTSGYLVKFDGTNTITNGPQLGNDTTKFLRNDGTWAIALTSHQDISGKVNKSGDTMTGNLVIGSLSDEAQRVINIRSVAGRIVVGSDATATGSKFIYCANADDSIAGAVFRINQNNEISLLARLSVTLQINNGLDYSSSTTQSFDSIHIRDEDGGLRTRIYNSISDQNYNWTWIMTREPDQTNGYNQIGIGLNASKEPIYSITSPIAFRNALGASSGTWPVSSGGTGATTFTAGAALIGNGTSTIATRSITNLTTSGGSVTANTNLITANTLVNYAVKKAGDTITGSLYLAMNQVSSQINFGCDAWSYGSGTNLRDYIAETSWGTIHYDLPYVLTNQSKTLFSGQYIFTQKSPTTSGSPTNYSEYYKLPLTTAGRSSNAFYNIITTKNLEDIIIASGTQSISSVPTSSSNVTITFSPALPDTNYIVIATPNVNSINVGVQQKQTDNFKLFYKSNTGSTVTNATVNWAILKL